MSATTTQPTTEEQLWHAFQKGCPEAYAQLYERYVDTLYQYSVRFTNDRDLIKDCIHDLFVELWRSRDSVSSTTSVRYYLLACIKRKVLRHLEKQQRKVSGEDSLPETHPTVQTESPESGYIHEQQWGLVQSNLESALAHLTKRQREAVFLKFYQNLPYDQIAGLMGVNSQSVYNLIFGALRILKKHVSAEAVLFSALVCFI